MLIARFIDKEAEFVYVPAEEVFRIAEQTGAIPYDIPVAELSHVDERCMEIERGMDGKQVSTIHAKRLTLLL